MTTPGPVPRHIFGIGSGTADNLHWLNEHVAIYTAGQGIVLFNPESRSQQFLAGAVDTDGISALCVSPNRKYLAVGERAPKATVTIYDLATLKRRKVLVSTIAGGKDIASMAFSPDARYLAVQYGGPEWNLALWTWEKARMAGSACTSTGPPIRQVCFSPFIANDGTAQVSVAGPGMCKSFKCADVGGLRPVPIALSRRPDLDITCHAWLAGGDTDRIVAGTESGELFYMEGGEILEPVSCGAPVRSMCVYSKGLAVGLNNGTMLVYSRDPTGQPVSEEESPLTLLREVSAGLNLGTFVSAAPVPAHTQKPGRQSIVPGTTGHHRQSVIVPTGQQHTLAPVSAGNGGSITALAISPSEDLLGLLTADRRLMTYNLGSVDAINQEVAPLVPGSPAFHSGEVVGMCGCIRKPLLATISRDHTLRIWNYRDRVLEIAKSYDDEITSIALHPSGLFALVGFADKLRLMAILLDDFRVIKEFGIKSCAECCFSHGGHMFAAQSGTSVSIFNFYTFESMATLRGHGGKVGAIVWLPDDSRIVTAGADGAVYEWRLSDQRRLKEHVVKGCIYSSVVLASGARSMYATGSDQVLRELEESAGGNTTASTEVQSNCTLTKLATPQACKYFFAGTDQGKVRMYKLPLTGDFTEMKVGSGPVTQLALGLDDGYLFAATADGLVAVFDMPLEANQLIPRKQMAEISFAEEVLVGKAEMDEKRTRITELELQVTEMQMQHEYQIRLREANAQDRLRVANEEAAKEAAGLRARTVSIQRSKEESEAEAERTLHRVERLHQEAVSAMEAVHGQRLGAEADRYSLLTRDMALERDAAATDKQAVTETHTKEVKDLVAGYEVQLQQAARVLERTQAEGAQASKEGEEMRSQIEMDADREVEMQRERYETQLAAERDASQRLKAENVVLQRKMGDIQAQMEAVRAEAAALGLQKAGLLDNVAELEADVRALKRECSERDELLVDKDRRISDVKSTVVELQKLKFVLEYKVDELRGQALPREQKLDALTAQISEMDKELAQYHTSNTALHAAVSDANKQQTALRQEMTNRFFATRATANQLRQMQGQIAEAVELIQDPDKLKAAIVKIYQMHVEGTDHHRKANAEVEQEFSRQRDYLEKTVADLKNRLSHEASNHARDHHKALQENMVLVKEIATLRQEIKSAKSSLALAKSRSKRFTGDKVPRASKDSTGTTASKLRESTGTEDLRSMGMDELIPARVSVP